MFEAIKAVSLTSRGTFVFINISIHIERKQNLSTGVVIWIGKQGNLSEETVEVEEFLFTYIDLQDKHDFVLSHFCSVAQGLSVYGAE